MKRTKIILWMLPVFLIGFSCLLGAERSVPATSQRGDQSIALDVSKAIRNYAYYDIYDWVVGHVQNGVVTLNGYVRQPWHETDLEKRVQRIHGVKTVESHVQTLPLSGFDNQLRRAITRKIYRNAVLSRYALGPHPAIHIIVDEGRVTLYGLVDSKADQNLASMLARESLALRVTNDLQVARNG